MENMGSTEGDPELKHEKWDKKSCDELDELNELSKEALIERVKRLHAHNKQLLNILQKQTEVKPVEEKGEDEEKKARYSTRHVFIKLYYLGWDYKGFVAQENTAETIEQHLFHALKTCRLIQDKRNCNYQLCGRTDKGVSALKQTISLDLRSRLENPNADNCDQELNYLQRINRLLPENIQCYAWAHVPSDLSARFACTSRTYRYYFPRGCLDIELMKEGAKRLIGQHDFRNFCKVDVPSARLNCVKEIMHADVEPCSSSDSVDNVYSMWRFVITGSGFLWHQIRAIMAILTLIGKGKEPPDIITELLDVEKHPSKPQYDIAHYEPLTLFDADFANSDIKWNTSEEELRTMMKRLVGEWSSRRIRETMVRDMIEELSKNFDEFNSSFDVKRALTVNDRSPVYKPLLSRNKCDSLEKRIEHFVKKRKIVKVVANDTVYYMTKKRADFLGIGTDGAETNSRVKEEEKN